MSYARARQIKNLRIDEVSSVSAGAGRGVSVVLMKSNSGETVMSTPNLSQMIRKAAELRGEGRISAFTEAHLHKHFAVQRFPNARSPDHALSLWYDTAEGAGALNSSIAKGRDELTARSRVGDGDIYLAAVSKQAGKVPEVRAAQSARLDDDGAPPDWQDHSDMKTAVARMRGVDPSLNERQAEDRVHSIRLRRERRAKAGAGI